MIRKVHDFKSILPCKVKTPEVMFEITVLSVIQYSPNRSRSLAERAMLKVEKCTTLQVGGEIRQPVQIHMGRVKSRVSVHNYNSSFRGGGYETVGGVTDELVKRENKKNYLHLIDMAKNKTILQTLK